MWSHAMFFTNNSDTRCCGGSGAMRCFSAETFHCFDGLVKHVGRLFGFRVKMAQSLLILSYILYIFNKKTLMTTIFLYRYS